MYVKKETGKAANAVLHFYFFYYVKQYVFSGALRCIVNNTSRYCADN
jgi:hypothetical protein